MRARDVRESGISHRDTAQLMLLRAATCLHALRIVPSIILGGYVATWRGGSIMVEHCLGTGPSGTLESMLLDLLDVFVESPMHVRPDAVFGEFQQFDPLLHMFLNLCKKWSYNLEVTIFDVRYKPQAICSAMLTPPVVFLSASGFAGLIQPRMILKNHSGAGSPYRS